MTVRSLAYRLAAKACEIAKIRLTPGQFWKLKFAIMEILREANLMSLVEVVAVLTLLVLCFQAEQMLTAHVQKSQPDCIGGTMTKPCGPGKMLFTPAQKPAKEFTGKILNPNGGTPNEWPANSHIVFAIPSDFWKQVEQHCVAVLPDPPPKSDRIRDWPALKLRCTPDPEPKP